MKQSDHERARRELGFPFVVNEDIPPSCSHYFIDHAIKINTLRCIYCGLTKQKPKVEDND